MRRKLRRWERRVTRYMGNPALWPGRRSGAAGSTCSLTQINAPDLANCEYGLLLNGQGEER